MYFLEQQRLCRSLKVYFCLQGNCIKIWAFSARLTACHIWGRATTDDDWLPPQISTNRRVQQSAGVDPALGVGVSGGLSSIAFAQLLTNPREALVGQELPILASAVVRITVTFLTRFAQRCHSFVSLLCGPDIC